MSGNGVKSLDDVFKKWEKKGEERRRNPSRSILSNLSNGNGISVLQPGKAAWVRRFDDSAMPRRRSSRRKHQDLQASSDLLSSSPIERKFHLTPPVVEDLHRSTRPFLSTGCPRCTQKSKAIFVTEKAINNPLRNLLDISMLYRRSLFTRVFSDVLYVVNLPSVGNQKKTTDIKNSVLISSRVSSTIQRLSLTHDHNPSDTPPEKDMGHHSPSLTSKELKVEAGEIITGMMSSIKGYLIKFSAWFLFKFFGKILSSIHVHQGQIAMLHEASKKNIPLVYLPLHKSHVDYVLISLVLSSFGLKVPYIAAGDNLEHIPLFSLLMNNMGGFFIKRSLGDNSPKNELYKVILSEYIIQMLGSRNSIEVFIEGTRSRTGKCYLPKIGVLSTIVTAVREGRISDVFIVPVNISYEKILEEGYAGELLGEPKKPESFLRAVKSIWRIVWSHFGQVRVDFGLPFSLLEHIRASETSEACQAFMNSSVTKSVATLTSENSIVKNSMSEISLESLDGSSMSLTKCIAHHVIYDCVNCSTIMGTNMVAFLLLTKFRKGVQMNELESALESLKKDLLIRKRDFGFSGSNKAVICHSLNILGKDLVSWDNTSSLIRPYLSLPSILQLMYYSNQVLSVYVLESVVACSIGALLTDENISLLEFVYQSVTISRRELLDTALDLCDLLHREFVFTPPCLSLETSLIEAIESFIAADVLNVREDQSAKSREKQWTNRLAVSTAWLDEDDCENEEEIPDQEYMVNSSKETLKKLMFFRSMLAPIIESYWFVSCSFLWLRNQDFTEKEFMKELHNSAIKRVETGTALYNESCCVTYLVNAVKVFEKCNILDIDRGDQMFSPRVKLTCGYETEDAILDLISQIDKYKT